MFRRFSRNFTNKTFLRASFLTLGLTAYSWFDRYTRPQCCGIIGVISKEQNVERIITEGIQLLQNRGYDSAGIVTFRENSTQQTQVQLTKYAIDEEKDCIEKVVSEGNEKHKGSYIGIGHTRWATCGGKSSVNAHPHFDQTHNYYLVHNGTIVNYKQLKEKYLSDTVFTSETDTEVIVQLLARECTLNNLSVFQGIKKVQEYLIGQWGLVIINKNQPEEICLATYGSPILVGFGDKAVYVASQSIAFQKHTKQYFATKNGQVLLLSLSNINQIKQQMKQKGRMLTITNEVKVKVHPDPPFRSFYEEEVHEQGEIKFKPYLKSLEGANFDDNLTILGCGSSFYASLYAQKFFKRLRAFKKVQIIDAAELISQDIQQNQSLILVSQSGQTKDLLNALDMSKKAKGVKSIGVINVVGSALARNVDCPVYTNVGREVAVGATKSFLHQILNLLAIGVSIGQAKGNSEDKFLQGVKRQLFLIPEKLKEAIQMSFDKVKIVAGLIHHKESIYLLGKAESIAIAKEGALKIKELNYIHAQAFGASEMKHGPLALVNCDKSKQTTVIFIILDDKNLNVMKVAVDQLHSRKAYIVVITNCINKLNKQKIDQYIEIPYLEHIGSLVALVPLQLLSNEICVFKGVNPDKPRNLAKTVTV